MGWFVPTWECPHIVMYVDSAAAALMSREGSIRERSFFVCVSGIVCCGVIVARPYGMAVD